MIARQTARGGMLMVGARLITRCIDLVTMLVMARLLLTTDFGLVAIAVSAVAIVESALELPLNQALLRLPVISKAQYDTAFTLALLRALILTTILVAGAWPFALYYGDFRLVWLVCVLAVGANARGLASPRLAEYQKNMSFWRDFAMELGGKGAGCIVGITAAVLTDSYWSIAAGAVAVPLTILVISYCFAPYRPRLSLAELPIFSGFLGWMTAAQLISAITWQSERLWLGKIQTKSQLGLFTTASDMSQIPLLALFGPIIRPLLAAFSLLQGDRPRLASSYQSASNAIMMVGLPLLVGECLVAEPAIRLLLDKNWLGAIPILQLLSLSAIPGLFALAAIPLVMSSGNTQIFLRRNLIEFLVKIPIVIVGGLAFGIAGIAASRVISEAVGAAYCMFVVRRLTGLSLKIQLFGPWRCFVATLVMAPAVIGCVRYLTIIETSPFGTLQSAILLMATAGLGAFLYVVTILMLWMFSGRPQGIEAMAFNVVSGVVLKTRRRYDPSPP